MCEIRAGLRDAPSHAKVKLLGSGHDTGVAQEVSSMEGVQNVQLLGFLPACLSKEQQLGVGSRTLPDSYCAEGLGGAARAWCRLRAAWENVQFA